MTEAKGALSDPDSQNQEDGSAPSLASPKIVLLLCAATFILDGLDNQALALAIPAIAREWSFQSNAFAVAAALGLAGMALGPLIGGTIGDRYGRRPAILIGALTFGLTTLILASVSNLDQIALLRFISGLGLAAVLPAGTALLVEHSHKGKREQAVMIGMVCVPVGGMLGSFLAPHIIETWGWRNLFVLAGGLTLMLCAILFLRLPESPLYRRGRRPGPANGQARGDAASHNFSGLFVSREYARNTVLTSVTFFFTLMVAYAMFVWIPTLIVKLGFSFDVASRCLAVFNLGGILGVLPALWLIRRLNVQKTLCAFLVLACLALVVLVPCRLSEFAVPMLYIAFGILGMFLLNAQMILYTLSAQIYPPELRSRGVGVLTGFGRLGAIVGAYGGVWLIEDHSKSLFMAMAIATLLSIIAIAFMRTLADDPLAR